MYNILDNRNRPSVVSPSLNKKPIVFVVDDDVSVRESLELLIHHAGWQPILFGSAKEFLSHDRVDAPSCLILDVKMPGLSGLELQRLISSDRLRMPIIFITGYRDVPMTVRAMKAGAFEFLTKPIDPAALLQAIRSAAEYSVTVSNEDQEISRLEQSYFGLTSREREVMALVIQGLLNKQIAFELNISEITVKHHRGRVMRKMHARSFLELVNMAAKLHLDTETPS
ncbi:FixJ family two-component response regulator [Phyllobacterium sp. 1468]|uniref:response regulator transcription factor n=1 Tax=Phyllobacterium sp. 1468 TaxID=2817759 RepID=UPI00285EACF2|nr:response regulator [Phyllobacterium sp. 1468]MDR6635105.1 FixJ family two-component response regulator [Phyllobacterium sp. 1468]